MLFDPGQREAIRAQWQQLEEARQRSDNRLTDEDTAEPALFSALGANFKTAQEADTPQAWRSACDAIFDLRSHLRKIDVRETSFFDALVDFDDLIEGALKEARNDPRNAIAYRELEELRESIDEAQTQIRDERNLTPVWERERRRRLEESDKKFEEGKRQINILSNINLTVHFDFDGLVAGVKELVEVVEKAVKLTRDEDFTGPLKRAADKVWQATKRFVRATKQRFVALGLPWRKTSADDNSEGGSRVFKDFDGGPEMAVVPPGRFWMGSKDGEGSDYERPRHEVTIPQAFAVGRYPITFEEWDFAQADTEWAAITGMEPRKPEDEGWGRDRRPVINVSWDDAQTYIRWLSLKTSQAYRLLSEAEWEYACRAGSEGAYSFGDGEAELGEYAWYEANSKGRTHPVGQKKPNKFGLHDILKA